MVEPEEQAPNMTPSGVTGIVPPVEHRWKKGGPSPNPGGRKKGADIRSAVNYVLSRNIDPETGHGEKTMEVAELAVRIATGIASGEVTKIDPATTDMIKWTTDQACGKLTDKSEVSADVEVTGGVDIVRGHGPMRDPPEVPKPPPKKE